MYNGEFTDNDIQENFKKCVAEAEEIYLDKEKTSRLMKRVKKLLINISRLPIIGKYASDILDIADMIKDYRSGTYTAIPQKSITAFLGVLLYFASPVDLAFDIVPVFGWLDDIAVLALAYKSGLAKDLEDYRKWKADNLYADYTVIDDGEEDEDQT